MSNRLGVSGLIRVSVNNSQLSKSWGDNDEIADLPDEHLRVFQIPASQASNQATSGKNNSINSSNGRWETCIIIMLLKCNNQTFGSPLVLRLARDVTGKITFKLQTILF